MDNRKDLFKKILNKNIFIWGARMTGIGALRQINEVGINIIGFIDSDPAFKDKKVHGLEVIHPDNLAETTKLYDQISIIIAVALKEEEIVEQLNFLNIKNAEVFSFMDDNAPYYTIDILGSCNLKCASCPHSILESNVPKGSMKLETFKKVFDKVISEAPDISHISLYSWGEPLLHPYINEIIDYVHDKNVAVALSSNLSIKFGDRIEKIIKSKPDYLKISLSGYYENAYNNTHAGGDIELVKKNMRMIREFIDKYHSPTLVDINYHLYRDNCGENLNKMKELSDELGFIMSVTHALVMPLERVIKHIDGKTDNQTKELQENLLVTIDEGINASSKIKLPEGNCPFRENQININSDLTVPVCCTVWERGANVVSNNYLENTLSEINQKKSKVEICKKCMEENLPQYNMGFNKSEWFSIASKKTSLDVGSN